MPGVILLFEKNLGEAVEKGDVVLIMETMKMQILISALVSGKVTAFLCNTGDKVEKGAVLARIGQGLEAIPAPPAALPAT